VKFWVGLTDWNWFTYLAARTPLDEVNFWQPSKRRPIRLDVGAPFVFKLHAKQGGWIVGGGFVGHPFTPLPPEMAWKAFGEKNGAASFEEMVAKLRTYRRDFDEYTDEIGCNALVQPFFLPREKWIPGPSTWPAPVQSGKSFDTTEPEGAAIWSQVQSAMATLEATTAIPDLRIGEPERPRYGAPVLVPVRLGQGTFRTTIIDAYERRCAVTNERTLPVLEAAHIKPYSKEGPHSPNNGLLLRSDLHTLFDQGFLTVTPDLRVRVSRTIREKYENGRDYYALEGREIRRPSAGNPLPSPEYLEWHADTVFRG
jgi:putative restriction endonuclease